MGKGAVLSFSAAPLGQLANAHIKVLGSFLLATVVLGVLFLLYRIWRRVVQVWTVSFLVPLLRKARLGILC